jgi:hypothetical protein
MMVLSYITYFHLHISSLPYQAMLLPLDLYELRKYRLLEISVLLVPSILKLLSFSLLRLICKRKQSHAVEWLL